MLIEEIIKTPLFLKLKDVVENNPWHDHESVYDHSIKTKDIAKREIPGDFITNPEAKKLFLQFVNEDFYGMRRADLMILIALLHDIGKIISVKITDANGITSIPGHEYSGSTIVGKLLEPLSLNSEIITYIIKGIRTHGAFQGEYFSSKKTWPIEAIINSIKSKAEGLYIESMFNNFCDVYTAPPFQPYKPIVIKIFSEPKLYV